MFTFTISSFSFLGMSSAIAKQYYKWVDSKGSTHYTTKPPPKSAKMKGKVDTYGWQGQSTTTTQIPTTSTPSSNQSPMETPHNAASTPTNNKQSIGSDQKQREANAALKNGAVEQAE